MPNVLPTQPSSASKSVKSKHRVSALGVVLTIILAVVIILLGERIMFDLNRVANPLIESTVSQTATYGGYETSYLASEKSTLSSTRIYYPRDKTEDYRLYKLLIHAAFVLPAFLLMFLLYYWVNLKKRNPNYYVVTWAYMVGAIWILLHLIGEAGRYVIDAYKNAAIYIILVFLAVVLTSLAVFLQKKKNIN
jgi:hypothetical protein